MFARDAVTRYELLETVGRGGMAVVYRALAHVRGVGAPVPVVVKRLLPELEDITEFQRMLGDEALIGASLEHPNIVRVLDVGELDGDPFIAFERVDGIDLARALEQERRLDTPIGVYVILEVLKALSYAHGAVSRDGQPLRIVHRDVGAGNVLLSWSGAVMLADFGIAKATQRQAHTAAGQIKGNFLYMAPEQVLGQEVDARTDVYGAGMLLLTAATGRHPFEGEPMLRIATRIRHGNVPLPSTLDPGLPPELDDIVGRAIRFAPGERYQTAREFAIELAAFAQGRGWSRDGVHLARWLSECRSAEERQDAAPSIVNRLAPLIAEASAGGKHFRTDLVRGLPRNRKSATISLGAAAAAFAAASAAAAAAAASRPSSDNRPSPLASPRLLAGLSQLLAGEMATAPSSALAGETDTAPSAGLAGETDTAPSSALAGETDTAPSAGLAGKADTAPSQRSGNETITVPLPPRPDSVVTQPPLVQGTLAAEDEDSAPTMVTPAAARPGASAGQVELVSGSPRTEVLPASQLPTPPRLIRIHSEAVTALGVSRDGRMAVSASIDRTLSAWDPSPQSIDVIVFGEHPAAIRGVAVSPDASGALACGDDGDIHVWDLRRMEFAFTVRGHGHPLLGLSLASTRGEVFASSDAKGIVRVGKVTSANTGTFLRGFKGHRGPVRVVALAPDAECVFSGGDDGTIRIWSLQTGSEIAVRELDAIPTSAAWSVPDTIVVGCMDGTLRVLSTTLTDVRRIGAHLGGIRSVAVAGDGSTVFSGGDRSARLWRLRDGRQERAFEASAPITAVALVEGAGLVLYANSDGEVVSRRAARR